MKKIFFAIAMSTVFLAHGVGNYEHRSSAPYISGDTFRFMCDWILDDVTCNFTPDVVKNGDIIFVQTEHISHFFQAMHPYIKEKYILVTHNADDPIPGRFMHFLDDPKLIGWFGQNVENYSHPKLHPLPIGCANPHWYHGNTSIISKYRECLGGRRNILLYLNIDALTNCSARSPVLKKFAGQPFCFNSPRTSFEQYLTHLSQSKFVLSPRGNGLDCHRTWEALYMGAIPVVLSSSIDSLFENLPVVIVHDWSEVTESFLLQAYEEMSKKEYQWEKLFSDYWFKKIRSFANNT